MEIGETQLGPFTTQHITEVRQTIFGPVVIGWMSIDFEAAAKELRKKMIDD